jgi:NAD-dependent dihydropyrimidine dehydrogenase PreA subunit
VSTTESKKSYVTTVEEALCKACGYCAESCPKDVFEPADHLNEQGYTPFVAAHTENCIGCLNCLALCPDFAITVEEAEGAAAK